MRILIPNSVTVQRYEKVKGLMRKLGAPVIDCIEISPGFYFALDGSHRLTAARELNLCPALVVIDHLEGQDPVLDKIRKEVPVRLSRGLLLDFSDLSYQ